MSEAQVAEFPFVAELPKREKGKLAKAWDQWLAVKAVVAERGPLIPASFAAKLLNISHQRVSQLADSGKLQRVDIGGSFWITEASLVELAKGERKAGRPFKVRVPGFGECKEVVRETYGLK